LGGGVNAAQLFGELEGALGFAAVGEEPAGLPAHPPLGQQVLEAGGDGYILQKRTAARRPVPVATAIPHAAPCPLRPARGVR
jgi:hypothetical protein